jgi:hypothetical protein
VLAAGVAAAGDRLATWLVFGVMAVAGLGDSFHGPTFCAAMTLLVSKEQLGRANGLAELAAAVGLSIGPVLATLLLQAVHISRLLYLDVAALCMALAAVALVRIGSARTTEATCAQVRLSTELLMGWRFVIARGGLVGLLFLLAVTNFTAHMVGVLTTPLVLAFSTQRVLSAVLAAAGAGMVCGGLLMSTWGGPRRRMAGVLVALALGGLVLSAGGTRPSALLVGAAAFFFMGCWPVVEGCGRAIWQVKVPVALQGRVFALRDTIAFGAIPLGRVAAGPLADRVFEPALRSDGVLASSVGRIFGVGPGRGIGFLLSLAGLSTLLVVAVAWLQPRVRLLEEQLPDAPLESSTVGDSREQGVIAS